MMRRAISIRCIPCGSAPWAGRSSIVIAISVPASATVRSAHTRSAAKSSGLKTVRLGAWRYPPWVIILGHGLEPWTATLRAVIRTLTALDLPHEPGPADDGGGARFT